MNAALKSYYYLTPPEPATVAPNSPYRLPIEMQELNGYWIYAIGVFALDANLCEATPNGNPLSLTSFVFSASLNLAGMDNEQDFKQIPLRFFELADSNGQGLDINRSRLREINARINFRDSNLRNGAGAKNIFDDCQFLYLVQYDLNK